MSLFDRQECLGGAGVDRDQVVALPVAAAHEAQWVMGFIG